MSAPYAQHYPYNGYSQQNPPPSQQHLQQYPQQYSQQHPQQYPQQHLPQYPAQPHQPYPYHGSPQQQQQQQQPYPQQYHNQYQQHLQQPSPQPYPQTQQYGPPQPQVYQQPYAPHAQGQITQAPSTPNPRSCYNCGRPDHFAQDCPEPKRAIPAGDIHRSAYHAHKRLKTEHSSNGTFVLETQPGFRPPAQSGLQGAAGHLEYTANQHPYQVPHPPDTPVADASQANNLWQYPYQPPQHTPYQQYPPHSSPPHANFTPYQGHPQQGFHHPMAPSTPGFDSRHPPPNRRPSYGSAIQQNHHSANHGPSSYSSTSPATRSTSQVHGQVDNIYSPPAVTALQRSPSFSPALDDGPLDLEEDEIGALDVPDFPTVQGATQAIPVAFPLPSNFVVADALAPYQPPDPESGGLVKSKYTKPADSLDANVRNSDWWEESFAKDPAFTDLINPTRRSSASNWSESRRSTDREFRPPFDRKKSCQTKTCSVRNAGRSPSFKAHHVKKEHDTWSRDRSRSPMRLDRRKSQSIRQDSVTRADYQHIFDASPMQTSPTDIRRNSIDAKPESPYRQAPHPPPPPVHSTSWGDGQSDGPSDRGIQGNGTENGEINGNTNGNGQPHTEVDGSVFSPSKLRSERSYGRRRESSEESDTPRRRQVDDVTPRHKQRQPKVAAAYSRRW